MLQVCHALVISYVFSHVYYCELEIVTKIFLLNYKTKHDTVLYVCLLEHPRLISYFVQQFFIINIVALSFKKKT